MGGKTSDRLFMWAGGKSRMIPHYTTLFPEDLALRPYVEPFAGGAALFAHLSQAQPISATISDINREIIDLYKLVRDEPEFLIEEMARLDASWMALDRDGRKALYYRLRQEYWTMPEGREATARLYFLMKTGFNGIWQTCKASGGRYGTPVGLANQKVSTYRPDTIRNWAKRLANTRIVCAPYQTLPIDTPSFIFCDPPYRDSFTSYATTFGDAEQLSLIEWCRETHARTGSVVWLSNRDAGDGFFETHAPDAALHRFPITYTAGRRKRTEAGFEAKPATELLLVWK